MAEVDYHKDSILALEFSNLHYHKCDTCNVEFLLSFRKTESFKNKLNKNHLITCPCCKTPFYGEKATVKNALPDFLLKQVMREVMSEIEKGMFSIEDDKK